MVFVNRTMVLPLAFFPFPIRRFLVVWLGARKGVIVYFGYAVADDLDDNVMPLFLNLFLWNPLAHAAPFFCIPSQHYPFSQVPLAC